MLTLHFGEILLILIIHWWADFIMQSHEQAVNKSRSFAHLLEHTIMYTSCWWFAWIVVLMATPNLDFLYWLYMLIAFIPVTFVCHTVTDYFTSRATRRFFDEKDYHNGFVVVGFDQILHYVQLFLTYIICRNAFQ